MESENTDLPAKNKGLVWLEQHKVQIGIGVFVAISSIVSITIAAKTGHTPKFKTICNGADKGVATIAKAAEKASLPVVNLTGVKKTATGLGHDLLLSNQAVNKRLVSSGMMTKEPWGYKLTEVGKLFGKETVKVTRGGMPSQISNGMKRLSRLFLLPTNLRALTPKKLTLRKS